MKTRAGLLWCLLAAAGVQAAEAPEGREAYARCAPSVVMVTATETVPRGLLNRTRDLLDPFPIWETPGDVLDFVTYPLVALMAGPLKAGGSGVIIDAEGHFLTNHHVIAEADVFWATLHDRRVIRARLVGSDEEEDYALLRLELDEGETVTPAALGDSDALRPGDRVFAIGSPLRFRNTLSTGVVSATERRLDGPFQDFIQTDITIAHGSSGGPLFNARGDVVGLTALIYTAFEPTGVITFSVPINAVKDGLGQLRESGAVVRGYIGAHVRDVTPRVVEEHDLKVTAGAWVEEVGLFPFRATPAHDAGLRDGDVIVEFGEVEIDRAHTLARAVLNTKPGSEVTVVYRRGDARETTILTVAER